MKHLDNVIQQLTALCNPVSIFLYGSRSRADFLLDSDYEIGVLMPKNRYIGVMHIRESISLDDKIHVFPFELEDFLIGVIDTPFQKSIYLRELFLTAKTLYGEKLVEKIIPPPLKLIDLIQELRFNLGYAMASLISYRQGDIETALFEFYKSNLFGTRCLEILLLHRFPLGYDEIFELSQQLDISEYTELIRNAYMTRKEGLQVTDKFLYKNISYLNEHIEYHLLGHFERYGNTVLID